ncbi:MAG TPA: molybdopterin-dependent oxidoreductase [Acidiphilium sp.]|nr:MAG: xanthine dehydrogenase [Acidiphilium sp. 21-60-14]OYV91871.1 MAG: xanthine dehydrogenase [Acidiphilium sp. 37-60-79]OZB41231.1 MAG: xanthine dehydrogenase [Acidiphilium sp. 34-60-192]HQT88019.1 molybdopterin-dependent oxidoreductase [Acidiphilium sp.]HQU23065.1 molybdopterin-dependent oxidoreductase [Acidiphilium sp.]
MSAGAKLRLSRRDLIGFASGMVVSFPLLARSDMINSATSVATVPPPPDAAKLYAWLAVHPDNTATLYTGKVDVGTGAQTALAQIAAEELDFPIDRLSVVMGTTSETVNQGPTYGSLTIRYAGPQIRAAAAAGRAALIERAAAHFSTHADLIEAKDGFFTVKNAPQRRISYGALVAGDRLDVTIGAKGRGFAMQVAPHAKLKNPADYRVVGQSIARKDIPAKVTGAFTYVQDVKLPGMLHGRVVRPYGVHATLLSVDENAVRQIPGFVQIVRRDNFLGVVCQTEWGAIKAAKILGSVLHPKGPQAYAAKWSNWQGLPAMQDIATVVREAPGKNATVLEHGAVDQALASAQRVLKATFESPFQMHGSIGPSCAIAEVTRERAIIWSGTQMPHQDRHDIAKLLDMNPDQLEINWFEAAGAYGRNGLDHAVADAAIMSQAVGKPVRVQWMRWDEHGWEPKGPPIVQDLEAAIDANGKVTAWKHHMWVPTLGDSTLIAAALIGHPNRVGSIGHGSPAVTYAYDFPNAQISGHDEGKVALRTAWLRSPAQFETTFAMEAFIDELAAATKSDPLQFRLDHLKDPRAIAVLRAAAAHYGWQPRPAHGKPPKNGQPAKGRGIAWVNRDDTRVATIADVIVDPASGRIQVTRVVVAQDCGLVINPDGVRNQVEGNVIQSLSRTLHEEVTFDHANVTSRDWVGYPILRFDQVPDSIEVVIVNNDPKYPSHGAGEPSTCPTAAVIANAVFDATGARLRQLPFRPARVKAALT